MPFSCCYDVFTLIYCIYTPMDEYKSIYVNLNFERAGLFELIRKTYASRDVLYAGCSTHITPSLYFSHVVYVDQSQEVAQFFKDEKLLLDFINRKKTYKRSCHIQFLWQDYSTPLPVLDNSFDLLLALFAGGVSKSCSRYLNVGGILLTNNHRGDAREAAQDHRLELIALIRFQKGKYKVEPGTPEAGKIPARQPESRYLKQASQGMEYVENETYYVFERLG